MRHSLSLAVLLTLVIFIGVSRAQVPLSLPGAVNRALKAHPDVLMAERDVARSRAVFKNVRSSRFPKIDFLFENQYTKTIEKFEPTKIHLTFDDGTDKVISPTKDVPEYQSEIAVQATEKLFSGGRIFSAIKGARAGIRSAERARHTSRRGIALAATRAYWELKRAQEVLRIDQEKVEHAEDILKAAKSRHAQGAISKLEREKAQVDFLNHQGDLSQSQTARKIAEDTLWLEMGQLEAEKRELVHAQDEPSFQPVTFDDEELKRGIHDALRLRPEMQSAAAKIEAGEAGVGAARSGCFPQVELFGRYSWIGYGQDEAGDAWKDIDRNYWVAGVNITLNLFEGLATLSKIEEEKAVLANSLLEREKMRQSIIRQVRKAYNSLIGAAKRVTLLQQSIGLAERNLEAAKKQFALGAATIHEVAEYNVSMAETKKEYINALIDYEMAKAELAWARGEAWP
ncbi:MAG: TolC family protein [bacterium]